MTGFGLVGSGFGLTGFGLTGFGLTGFGSAFGRDFALGRGPISGFALSRGTVEGFGFSLERLGSPASGLPPRPHPGHGGATVAGAMRRRPGFAGADARAKGLGRRGGIGQVKRN